MLYGKMIDGVIIYAPPVKYDGKIYESTINNNIWSPVDYPAGWKEITEQEGE